MRYIVCLILVSYGVRCGDMGELESGLPVLERPSRVFQPIDAVNPADGDSPSRHHHLSITIDRESPLHDVPHEIPPNRLKYKLAIISAITAVITAGITATITILSTRRAC